MNVTIWIPVTGVDAIFIMSFLQMLLILALSLIAQKATAVNHAPIWDRLGRACMFGIAIATVAINVIASTLVF